MKLARPGGVEDSLELELGGGFSSLLIVFIGFDFVLWSVNSV